MSENKDWVVVECAPEDWLAPTTTDDTSDWITPFDGEAPINDIDPERPDWWVVPTEGLNKKDWIVPEFEKPDDGWEPPAHGDMFFSYDYRDKKYVPDNIHPKHKCHPCPPYFIGQSHILRNKLGEFRGFTWEQGIPVQINFNYNGCQTFIEPWGEETTYSKFLCHKDINATIYNFRMEEVISYIPVKKSKCDTLSLILDAKLSEGLIKGLYYIKLVALDISNSIPQLDNLVIINPGDIVLLVR